MARKRKTAVVVNRSAMADEVKTSNAPDNKSPLCSDNTTAVEPAMVEYVLVRRSCRLRNLRSPDRNPRVLKHFVDKKNENEKKETEKVVYALPVVVNEKEPGVEKQVFGKTNEGQSSDISYKSLYIQTQKKYEVLMENHIEAIRTLEFARGQIAAYEKMKDAMGGATREVILVGGTTVDEHQTAKNCMPRAFPHADHDIPKKKKATYNKKKKVSWNLA